MKNILIVLCFLILTGCGEKKEILYVYNWSDYISPESIMKFEEENNCIVDITTFDSNESAYAKLKAGASGYDLMFPSSYIIPLMIKEDMIEKLDQTKLQTVKDNFSHDFDSQIIDSNLTYSVPYIPTYTGLMYIKNKVEFKDEVSWDVIGNTKYKSRISMLDDMREVIGIGLMYNGYSLNSENEDEIKKATETICKWKKNIRKFDAESYKTEIGNGSLYIGHGYSSDANQIIIGDEDNPREDIGFILPKEGFTIAFDEMVILKNSKHKDLAYKFINFMYKEEISLENMIYNFSPMPNAKAIEKLPEEYKNIVLLDKETLKRGQVLKSISNQKSIELYNKAWDKIKAIKN